MQRRLARLLLPGDAPAAARAKRDASVNRARASERANGKAATKAAKEGLSACSFRPPLANLSNLALNRLVLPIRQQTAITVSTPPTELRSKTLELLGVDPVRTVPMTVTG